MGKDSLDLWEKPASGKCIIAGWHQWADAGEVSSGLPQYLIDETQARKVGKIDPDEFYLFQIPGAHDLLRPVVKLKEGHRESLQRRANEFFYAGDGEKGFFVFLGNEPHKNEALYAKMFLKAVEELGVKRVAILGGVHGPVPHDKNRQISCVHSMPDLKDELQRYAVELSNYEGGATIGTYLADRAEERDIELIVFYAIVPSYTFSLGSRAAKQMAMELDYKAWYDVMIRLNHMFKLDLDLSDLERRGQELISVWDLQVEHLAKLRQSNMRDYLRQVREDFTERTFEPLSNAWEDALGEVLEDS
jgi:proteasome assembly chaperone (PAC2) family protein